MVYTSLVTVQSFMKAKKLEKNKAILLREKGYSLKEIADNLNVSKGSVSPWVRDVKLNKKARNRIDLIKSEAVKKAMVINHEKRILREKICVSWAKKKFNKSKLNLFENRLICSLLYWGEGAKFSNAVEFTNSDPKMVRIFLNTLCFGFGVDRRKIRANMHLHEYHNEKKQKKMWCDLLDLSESQFNKSYLKPNSEKIKREGYPGCIRICYYSKEIVDKIKAFYKELSKI